MRQDWLNAIRISIATNALLLALILFYLLYRLAQWSLVAGLCLFAAILAACIGLSIKLYRKVKNS